MVVMLGGGVYVGRGSVVMTVVTHSPRRQDEYVDAGGVYGLGVDVRVYTRVVVGTGAQVQPPLEYHGRLHRSRSRSR